jgi:amino-acid N-acetyltransferase
MQATTHSLRLTTASTPAERNTAITLLRQYSLPTTDINSNILLYLLLDNQIAIGTAGLEVFGDIALLRSVTVHNRVSGMGYGKWMVARAEQYAKANGIRCLYLLTTTAKDFFAKQAYEVITREEAPAAILQSSQFVSLCPASAVLMKKNI